MIQLPNYALMELVHESRRTRVYRGMRKTDRAAVIVKLPAAANPTVADIKRFRREFELGTLFEGDRHVLTYYALESFAGGQALIVEDFGALSLERLVPEHGFSLKAFLDTAVQLARGLGEIHRAEVVHKDIKPSNLVMNPKTGLVKFIDFGISSRLAREYLAAETPERLEGSLLYMSPEQTGRMNRSVDFRSDFYSLGVTLYHLLCGRPPFAGEDALELVHCHIAREPTPIHEVRPGIPKIVSAIIGKLMAKDVEQRYQSGAGLLSDLEHCRGALEEGRPIDLHRAGSRDVREHFFLSQKLYGRDAERDTLCATFAEVREGRMRALLVSGSAGIGKSSLIRELHKPAAGSRAYFLHGKYDRLARNIPYSALAGAFKTLIDRILEEPEAEVAGWRERLRHALGPNARVLCDVLPDLKLLLPDSPPVDELGPIEARNRFYAAFLAGMEVLAAREHPLVLFLDDVQWADPAGLELLERLILEGRPHYFLLVCAYRDNEVDDHHLLEITLNNLARKGVVVPHLRLGALQTTHLADLIADSLGCSAEEALPLAGLVRAKTNGNPFFCSEWLKSLHERRYLCFDHAAGRWRWNTDEIAELDVAANVVDFLVAGLKQLPPDTGKVLRTAACLGIRFDLAGLAATCRQEQTETARHLWPALRWGLVVPLNRNYRLMDPALGDELLPEDIHYRFQHDRVQQAAYALLPEDQAGLLHLDIGRRMLARAKQGTAIPITDILNHLNRARQLTDDGAERRELARLNLEAGCKALNSVAYKQARTYLDTALACMGDDMWQQHYDQAFEIHFYRAQAAFFSGDHAAAERLCRELIDLARTAEEKARVLEIRIAMCTTKGDMRGALDTGLQGLAMLGIKLGREVGRFQLRRAYWRVKRRLLGTRIEDLHQAPDLADNRIRAALNLLMRVSLPAYLTADTDLYALVSLTRVDLCLTHGNCPEAAPAYCTHALLLGALRGRFSEAEQFGRLALKLDDRYRYLPHRAKTFYLYGLTIYPWSNHWSGISGFLKDSVAYGYQAGDFLHAAMAAAQVHQWDPTLDLDTAYGESLKYLAMIKEMGYREIDMQARLFQQLRLNLMGRTLGRLSLSDNHFAEDAIKQDEFRGTTMMTTYHVVRLQLCFLYGEIEKAEWEADIAEPSLGTVLGLPISVDFCFYAFLTLAAAARTRGYAGLKRRMNRLLHSMRRWADHCPENFAHRLLLMEAELAGLLDRESHALDLYQQAQETARTHGWQAHEALAAELMGEYLIRRGRPRLATGCLRDAANGYGRWGAPAKVSHLRARHPEVFPMQEEARRTTPDQTSEQMSLSSVGGDCHERVLDLNSVIKSSLAISGEIEYRRLVAKMMDIVVEAAGARKAVLVRAHPPNHRVEAVAMLAAPTFEVIRAELLDDCRDLCTRVARFTLRTGQVVELANASADRNFSRDPYITEHDVKSVLCLPIRHKDEVKGALYLENNLVEGAFTKDRINLLRLLVAQAAISLENARLLSDARRAESEVRKLNHELGRLNEQLEQKVRDRTEELHDVQKELLEKAHQAGMAEVATSVLHNVGNILNSVITSCQLIHSTVDGSRLDGLLRANEMLRPHIDDLAAFVTDNPKAPSLMRYYLSLEAPYAKERRLLLDNTRRLLEKVESIRNVILAQQSYATKGFQNESLALTEVVEDALAMLAGSLARARVTVVRDFGEVPHLFLPRNKLIHLFINLIKNALEAMDNDTAEPGTLTISVGPDETGLCAVFRDTGSGIDAADLDQIFQHGFTTKSGGHGFGLHSVANTMSELGGRISVQSDGPGRGASFVLAFPMQAVMGQIPN